MLRFDVQCLDLWTAMRHFQKFPAADPIYCKTLKNLELLKEQTRKSFCNDAG